MSKGYQLDKCSSMKSSNCCCWQGEGKGFASLHEPSRHVGITLYLAMDHFRKDTLTAALTLQDTNLKPMNWKDAMVSMKPGSGTKELDLDPRDYRYEEYNEDLPWRNPDSKENRRDGRKRRETAGIHSSPDSEVSSDWFVLGGESRSNEVIRCLCNNILTYLAMFRSLKPLVTRVTVSGGGLV